MNRGSMKSNVNPFLKMSFETTTDFLRAATLVGDYDPLLSNSSRLVMGRPTAAGTGALGLHQPLFPED